MAKYRSTLSTMLGRHFLTDGGLETTVIFHYRIELPEFSSFVLLKNDQGKATLLRYFKPYLDLARKHRMGFILESPTWRANRDWGCKLGYSETALKQINQDAIEFLRELRGVFEAPETPILLSGCLGPRGDGYVPSARMSKKEATDYHQQQIETFADSEADLVSAFTLNYVEEGIGIAAAAQALKIPVSLSFTVETDGRLPSGESVQEAVEKTDAATNGAPAYYMINCAHPTHLRNSLGPQGAWLRRIRGIRANASRKSHAELNESTRLDEGDPEEFGKQHTELKTALPHLSIFGGCCGTDHRHVEQLCEQILK